MDGAAAPDNMGRGKPYSRIVGPNIKEHIAGLQQCPSRLLDLRVVRAKEIQHSTVIIICRNLDKIAVSQSGLNCAWDRFDEAIYRGIEGKRT